MELFVPSIIVSILAMGVIFLVLGILIWVIKVLTHFFPYQAPPPAPAKPQTASAGADDSEEHIAVIHSVLAHHLGRSPDSFHIVDIRPQ